MAVGLLGTPATGKAASKASTWDSVLLIFIVATVAAVICLAVVGVNWPWTGFKGNETLWDWLSMLATPVTIASLPIRLMAQGRVHVRHWQLLAIVAGVLTAVLIGGGYGLGWTWTGFHGESLWDWLHLLLLPAVLVFLPDWFAKGAPVSRAGGIVATVLLTAFALMIFGGYYGQWAWTGFPGNTFRDWLDLLIAPFLLPAACRWFHVQWKERAARAGQGTATVAAGPAVSAEVTEVTEVATLDEAVAPAQTATPTGATGPAEVTEVATLVEAVAPAQTATPAGATGSVAPEDTAPDDAAPDDAAPDGTGPEAAESAAATPENAGA